MMGKTARALLCVAILLLASLASAQTIVFSKDGLSLSYRLESLGTRDIETQPGSIQPMKLYRVRAWFTNGTANDVDIRGAMDVSFFSVSTAWTEAGHGSANFMAGVYKAGATIGASDIFLLDRFSTLYKGLTAGTLKGSELDECTGILAEMNARMQAGKLSQAELERYLGITQGKE
jgi:hypothetical protein